MGKEDVIYLYIYMYTGTLLGHKKEQKFAATWMDLEGIMLHGISQTEKDKYCMISLICRI